MLSPASLAWGEEFVREGATGDSLSIGGQSAAVSREMLESAIRSLQRARARVDLLLTQP